MTPARSWTRSQASRFSPSPRTSTSVSTSATSGSSSFTAETLWKAPITVESGSSAAACSAAEPSSTSRTNAPCLSNPSGLTQSTTTLPARVPASDLSRSPCPSHGTATITISPAAAAPSLSAPVTSPPVAEASVLAVSSARSALRLPITTGSPAAAKRRASPRPWGPVPPSTATVVAVKDSGRVIRCLLRSPTSFTLRAEPSHRVHPVAEDRASGSTDQEGEAVYQLSGLGDQGLGQGADGRAVQRLDDGDHVGVSDGPVQGDAGGYGAQGLALVEVETVPR